MRRTWTAAACVAAVAAIALPPPAAGDWNEGDPHKMHFPQLPDPDGWDIEFVSSGNKIGDDWQCSQSGPVSDIHIWLSWAEDNFVTQPTAPEDLGRIDRVGVEIYDNVPAGQGTEYSHPGTLKWNRVFDKPQFTRRLAGQGPQGFYAPQINSFTPDDHVFYEQLNIPVIDDPFDQVAGEIYWLVMWIEWDEVSQSPGGWKTADTSLYPQPFTGSHYEDDAVWWDDLGGGQGAWIPLEDPLLQGVSLDLAFVITPEPASVALLAIGGIALLARRR